ncbi:hypothetical protein [Paenibacillus hexagrammi]|uniref:Uncharacterized protein n=1 Tax=Paenibacillus hexagrammi TaxID=2908839 RepID=A0ABY3SKA1_9BACL|nr:hypothetical protein [Paenibacillus sp. YPD9-1]UJF33417.1 hypothetical protein L0M14_28575 [Paenibacillus sp. YPD9-1]
MWTTNTYTRWAAGLLIILTLCVTFLTGFDFTQQAAPGGKLFKALWM